MIKLTPVYDVTARETFDELLKWFKEIDTYCGEGIVKIVVGNKVDKVSSASRDILSFVRDKLKRRGAIMRTQH